MFTRSAAYYDALYAWKDYAAEAARIREIATGDDLLDVACGTGKHLELLRNDFRCEGLELDPEMAAIAQARLPEIPIHVGDMSDFDLGRHFDVVTCLFSSIGYVGTVERLNDAVAAMARHLKPGGALLLEPWLDPEEFRPASVSALFVDGPEVKIARMSHIVRTGNVTDLALHYMVGRGATIETFVENHLLTMFTRSEFGAAFHAAGLSLSYDPQGLMGRGLYVGKKSPAAA